MVVLANIILSRKNKAKVKGFQVKKKNKKNLTSKKENVLTKLSHMIPFSYIQSKSLSHRELLPADVGLPGLRLQQEQASRSQVLEDPLEETHEATVPPVKVDPLGHAQAHDDIVLWPLSQHQVIAVQYIIGLEERMTVVK